MTLIQKEVLVKFMLVGEKLVPEFQPERAERARKPRGKRNVMNMKKNAIENHLRELSKNIEELKSLIPLLRSMVTNLCSKANA